MYHNLKSISFSRKMRKHDFTNVSSDWANLLIGCFPDRWTSCPRDRELGPSSHVSGRRPGCGCHLLGFSHSRHHQRVKQKASVSPSPSLPSDHPQCSESLSVTAVKQVQARHKDGAQLWKTSRLPSKNYFVNWMFTTKFRKVPSVITLRTNH